MQWEQKQVEPIEYQLSVRIRENLCPIFLRVLSDSAVTSPFLEGKNSQE